MIAMGLRVGAHSPLDGFIRAIAVLEVSASARGNINNTSRAKTNGYSQPKRAYPFPKMEPVRYPPRTYVYPVTAYNMKSPDEPAPIKSLSTGNPSVSISGLGKLAHMRCISISRIYSLVEPLIDKAKFMLLSAYFRLLSLAMKGFSTYPSSQAEPIWAAYVLYSLRVFLS